jgi:hypothetical protein
MHPTSDNSTLLTSARSTVEIEYDTGREFDSNGSKFDTYKEPDVFAEVTPGDVLILQHKDGKVSAVSPSGWTRVSVR